MRNLHSKAVTRIALAGVICPCLKVKQPQKLHACIVALDILSMGYQLAADAGVEHSQESKGRHKVVNALQLALTLLNSRSARIVCIILLSHLEDSFTPQLHQRPCLILQSNP